MTIRLNGATSGYVELDAPAIAGTTSLTLPSSSGVVATTSYADNASGLRLVAAQSFSSVSSVTINNCFTSEYSSYRVVSVFTSPDGFSGGQGFIRLRTSSAAETGSVYKFAIVGYTTANAASNLSSGASSTWFLVLPGYSGTYQARVSSTFDVIEPQVSGVVTQVLGTSLQATGTPGDPTIHVQSYAGQTTSTTSYTGLEFGIGNSGTVSGSIRIYGYRNSL